MISVTELVFALRAVVLTPTLIVLTVILVAATVAGYREGRR